MRDIIKLTIMSFKVFKSQLINLEVVFFSLTYFILIILQVIEFRLIHLFKSVFIAKRTLRLVE